MPLEVELSYSDERLPDGKRHHRYSEQPEVKLKKVNMLTAHKNYHIDQYMMKDHLGNVRSLITEEQRVDKYPVASLEDSKIATEKNYYDIQDAQVVDKSNATGITDYVNDNGIGNNPSDPTFEATNSAKLYKLNSNTAKSGLGITLKVMAGDRIDVLGKSYYFQNTGGTSGNSPIPVLDLLSGFLNAPSGALLAHGTVTAGVLNTSPNITGINSMITQQDNESNNAPDKPRAYINVIFFDEQFRSYDYAVSMVGDNSVVKDHFSELQNIAVNKSGYVYIYCSNESPVDVFFDNLQVVHTRGPLLEENSYYPFGLVMKGISSKAAGSIDLLEGYQSYSRLPDFSLNLNETFYRINDPQLGRWFQIDPKPTLSLTPYHSMDNNPVIYCDPLGDITQYYDRNGNLLATINDNSKSSKAVVVYDDWVGVVAQAKERIESANLDLESKAKLNAVMESLLGDTYDISAFEKFYDDNQTPAKIFKGDDLNKASDFRLNGKKTKINSEYYAALTIKNGIVTVGLGKHTDYFGGDGYFYNDLDVIQVGDIHTHPFSESGRIEYTFKVNQFATTTRSGLTVVGPSYLDYARQTIYVNRSNYYSVIVDSKNIYLYKNDGNPVITIKR